jgi:hypothetical protein
LLDQLENDRLLQPGQDVADVAQKQLIAHLPPPLKKYSPQRRKERKGTQREIRALLPTLVAIRNYCSC